MRAREQEHLGEVGVHVSLLVEHVGRRSPIATASRASRSASACSPRRARTFATDLPPEHLVQGVVARAELAARDRPTHPPRRAARARRAPAPGTRPRRDRKPWSPSVLVQPASLCSELGRGGRITGQSSTPDGLEGSEVRRAGVPPPRSACSARASARIARASSNRPSIASDHRPGRRGGTDPDRLVTRSRRATRAAPTRGSCRRSDRGATAPGSRTAGSPPASHGRRRARVPPGLRHSARARTTTSPSAGVSDVQGHVVAGSLEARAAPARRARPASPPRPAPARGDDMPASILPQSSPRRSPAAAARSARASARRSAHPRACRPGQGLSQARSRGRGRPRTGEPERPRARAGARRHRSPARERAFAGRSQTLPCRGGEHGIVGQVELGAVREGLFEVVAEDLVELDELGPVLLQPGAQALMEIRAGRLGERLVRRVAEQQVAEAKAVLARDLRSVRPDQLLADERGEARGDLRLLGCECLDSTPVEDLALDRAALEDASLGRVELVEPGGEQGVQRWRHDDVALGLVGHRDHLLDEERVAARGARDSLPQVVGGVLGDEPVDVVVGQGLEPERHRPGGPLLGERGPCHAEQQDRRARGEQRDVLDQVVEGLLAPLDVVEHDHQRPLRGGLFKRLPERPGDLLRRRRRIALAEQRADRRRRRLVGRHEVELLQHLDDGPVGDPLAVREAAAAHDGRVDGRDNLRDEP